VQVQSSLIKMFLPFLAHTLRRSGDCIVISTQADCYPDHQSKRSCASCDEGIITCPGAPVHRK